jgi:hypothetical protein
MCSGFSSSINFSAFAVTSALRSSGTLDFGGFGGEYTHIFGGLLRRLAITFLV